MPISESAPKNPLLLRPRSGVKMRSGLLARVGVVAALALNSCSTLEEQAAQAVESALDAGNDVGNPNDARSDQVRVDGANDVSADTVGDDPVTVDGGDVPVITDSPAPDTMPDSSVPDVQDVVMMGEVGVDVPPDMMRPTDVMVPPDVVMPTDSGDSGTPRDVTDVMTPVDMGMECNPTSLSVGVRINATTSVVNNNRPAVTIGYTGNCSSWFGMAIPLTVRGLARGTQNVLMTTVDDTLHQMRGALDLAASEFADLPAVRSGLMADVVVGSRTLSTTFERDTVPPVIIAGVGNTLISPLSAGATSYSFRFRGDSIGVVSITLWRQRDNFELFRTSGTHTPCVLRNAIQSCPSDSLGEDQVCHYTAADSNSCMSSRLAFRVAVPNVSTRYAIPDADFRRASSPSMTAVGESLRVDIGYCDDARNCLSTSYVTSRAD